MKSDSSSDKFWVAAHTVSGVLSGVIFSCLIPPFSTPITASPKWEPRSPVARSLPNMMPQSTKNGQDLSRIFRALGSFWERRKGNFGCLKERAKEWKLGKYSIWVTNLNVVIPHLVVCHLNHVGCIIPTKTWHTHHFGQGAVVFLPHMNLRGNVWVNFDVGVWEMLGHVLFKYTKVSRLKSVIAFPSTLNSFFQPQNKLLFLLRVPRLTSRLWEGFWGNRFLRTRVAFHFACPLIHSNAEWDRWRNK